ncbi:hypothetical protein BU15DRAFT_46081 [Melanogaster broomeanus]|nr:hypothetical protein BU15DRAFT_46081 [Melanogaster broomeanus]
MSEAVSGSKAFQVASYIATNVQNILYGVELVFYFKTMQVLLRQGQRGQRTKSNIFYAFFSSMMFFLITVWVVTQVIFSETMWIQEQDYPGGPGQWSASHMSIWYMDLGTTAAIVLQLMTDALMIYRCRIVWNSYRIIVAPSILWVATLGLGIVVDWTSSSPEGNFFEGLPSILGLSYYTISALLNTTVTCIICYHIVRHGTRLKNQLGQEYAYPYFDVVSIIVESVLPYTLSGIAFLVSFGTGSPTSAVFLSVYIMAMCISPQMLILRVILRRARNDDRGRTPVTAVKFSAGGISTTSEESAVAVHFHANVYVPGNENNV